MHVCYDDDNSRLVCLGKKGFWNDAGNKPGWWSSKHVPFKCPNHPVRGQSKLTAKQMRRILREFLKGCPEMYQIDGLKEGKIPTLPPSSDESDGEDGEDQSHGEKEVHL